MSIQRRQLLAAGAALAVAAPALRAQDSASRPITLVVPYAPGGGSDTAARKLAMLLSARLRQSIIVENKPGAGGQIAVAHVARANPDGQTLLYLAGGATVTPALVKNLQIGLEEFRPVAAVETGVMAMMVAGALPVTNYREFLAYSKQNEKKLFFGNSTGQSYLLAEAFKAATKLDIDGMLYKGSSPTALALLRGEVQVVIDSPLAYRAFIEQGKVRPLLTVAPRKNPLLPDLPTVTDVGLPATLDSTFTSGVVAPKATPAAVVERINKAIIEVVASPEMLQQIKAGGRSPMPALKPEEYGQAVRREIDNFTKMAAAVNYTPE